MSVEPIVSANIDWYLMRPIMRHPPLCTRHELRTVYSINDLADFHEAMDEEAEYDRRIAAEQERRVRRGRK